MWAGRANNREHGVFMCVWRSLRAPEPKGTWTETKFQFAPTQIQQLEGGKSEW